MFNKQARRYFYIYKLLPRKKKFTAELIFLSTSIIRNLIYVVKHKYYYVTSPLNNILNEKRNRITFQLHVIFGMEYYAQEKY